MSLSADSAIKINGPGSEFRMNCIPLHIYECLKYCILVHFYIFMLAALHVYCEQHIYLSLIIAEKRINVKMLPSCAVNYIHPGPS